MTKTIGLVGLKKDVKCGKDGKWFELTFKGHDENIYTFRADHLLINDLIPVLITTGDMLAERRGEAKTPELGEVVTARSRAVSKFQVGNTTDFKNVVLNIPLGKHVSQSVHFPKQAALDLVRDIQHALAMLDSTQSDPRPDSQPKKSSKRGKGKPKKQVH